MIWPPPIHTGTLAPDGQKLSGADHYGNQFANGKESCQDADLDDVAVQFNMMVSAGDGMARWKVELLPAFVLDRSLWY